MPSGISLGCGLGLVMIRASARNLINESPLARYSKTYDLEFFNIPKCAMTTIRFVLGLRVEQRDSLPRSRHTFCVLRDPVDRFVSSYNSIVFRTLDGDEVNRCLPWYQEIINRINEETSVKRKVDVYLREIQEGGFFDSHHFPQSYFISAMYGRNEGMLDYAIDFSNLYEDLLRIPSIKKIGLEKKHLNRQHWVDLKSEDLSAHQVGAIKDLYVQDYELLQRWGL